MTTLTTVPTPRASREITVAYLGDLLHNAGFIDDKQRAEVEKADQQFRAQHKASKGQSRSEDEASPFKALAAMNLSDASGNNTRMDDCLLARLIA